MTRRIGSLVSLIAVLLAATAALPATASAGTISFVDGTFSYVAHPAEKDELEIKLSKFNVAYSSDEKPWVHLEFDSTRVTYVEGPGIAEHCERADSYGDVTIGCPLELVKRIAVDTKDREDTVNAGGLCVNKYKDGIYCGGVFAPAVVPHITVNLGSGNDQFDGGGDDYTKDQRQGGATVRGGAGDDLITGTMAADKLYGDAGKDNVYGMGGKDLVRGGAGNDTVAGVNSCGFSFCSKVYPGHTDPDIVHGDAGNDVVWGSVGADKLYGGAGNDTFFYANDRKRDLIDGGPGRDYVKGHDYARRTYQFRDVIRNVEKLHDERNPLPTFEWKCKGRKCTVQRINYGRPFPTVIVVFL